ncbi:MAG: signal recognition particle protein, partial [Pseudomonadota bacterium]
GMGDIVSLVEKAQETLEAEAAERMMKRFQKGRFDMNDLQGQLEQMLKLGGMQGIMGMLPGMGKIQKQMEDANMDDKVLKRQIAIIQSMTKEERKKPELMAASRKKRVAAGCGLEVSDVNKLLKMHRQMADMMKKMGKMGGKKGMRGMLGQMMGGGGLPPGLAAQARAQGGKAAEAAKGAGSPGALPPGFPGLGGPGGPGGALPPGLGGLSGLGKKK